MMSENIRRVHQWFSPSTQENSKIFNGSSEFIVEAQGLTRTYTTGLGSDFHALRDVALSVPKGASVALVGSSGSGKSTLLNLIAGLDRPSSGELSVAGVDLVGRSEDELSRHRGRSVGVVFQFFQLLPTLTALENVLLPMELVGLVPPRERRERGLALLERFEIVDQADKLPTTLSGGQQQRVAIARALANDPPLLVADEPTGNLDSRTAGQVLELLGELPNQGKTVIMATHETSYLKRFDFVVVLRDGRIVEPSDSQDSKASRGAASC